MCDLPKEVYERIAESLCNARDIAALGATCKNARAACLTKKNIRIFLPENREAQCIEWICKRLAHMEHLTLVGNLANWMNVWRFTGLNVAPNLSRLTLVNSGNCALCVASIEEVAPSCPVTHLEIISRHLHLGIGISRMKLRSAVLETHTLSVDHLAMTILSLQRLTIRGYVFNSVPFMGLNFTTGLRFLECPANVLPMVQHLPFLETLYVDSSMAQISSSAVNLHKCQKLAVLRLTAGEWTDLSWMPPSVHTLECVGCTWVGPLPHSTALHTISLVASRVSRGLAYCLSRIALEKFTFHSFNTYSPPFSVHCKIAEISPEDVSTVTVIRQ